MRNRSIETTLAILILAACQPACIPGDGAGRSVRAMESTVVIGVLSDIQGWNPYLTETAHSEDVLRLIYPQLAVEQPDYWQHPPSFEPSLASSWEFADDGLSLTLHLDEAAVWSDGVPVSADDVVFSHEVQTSPLVGWPGAVIKSYIEAVEAIDRTTVRFRFSHRYPYQMMDVNDGLIVPAHRWRQIPFAAWRDTDWTQQVLSAGPFMKAAHVPQQELVLVRNPRYWIVGRPKLERVVWRVIPNQGNLLTQLFTGEIDFMKGVPPSHVERVAGHPDLRLISFPDRGYLQVIWNTSDPLFDAVEVRRALTMAIDRQALIDAVYQGHAEPSMGPILSGMWAFNRDLEPMPYAPDQARELLAAAGWTDDDGDGVLDRDGFIFEFELLANSENQTRQDICMLIQQQLAPLGIRAKPRFVEWGTQLAKLREGDFEAAVHRWLEPTQIDLEELWHSPDPDHGDLNYARYSNSEVDRLIALANSAPDFRSQKPLFDRIQEIIVAEQPYTFLLESHSLDAINDRVQGAIVNDATPYFNLDEWRLSGGGEQP